MVNMSDRIDPPTDWRDLPWTTCVCSTCGKYVPGLHTRLDNWSLRDHKHGARRCPGVYSTQHQPAPDPWPAHGPWANWLDRTRRTPAMTVEHAVEEVQCAAYRNTGCDHICDLPPTHRGHHHCPICHTSWQTSTDPTKLTIPLDVLLEALTETFAGISPATVLAGLKHRWTDQ